MIFLVDYSTPFKEPVIIFALVLFIILLSPLILNKFRIPSIIGMILAGVAIGPHGFGLLEREGAINLFGTVGLLYIMFLAGLEIDMLDFKKNIKRSVVFGILTFSVPLVIGFILAKYILHYDMLPSLLIASMFSTQTMVAYPIVSRLGIARSRPVTITIGGTIITDTLVLLVLAVVSNLAEQTQDHNFWIRLTLSLIIFSGIVLFIFPIVARWFFKTLEGEGGSQFIFVLTLVFLAAFLAQVAGVEHIIGAFLAGLALNRLIPHQSALMNRLDFVGNNIFIPFFLINVGMIVDLHVFFTNTYVLLVTGLLIITALSTKYIAAWITQKIYALSTTERNLIFGLSSAHAAAILALVLVGYNLHLLDETILNGTILIILISCLVSSFVTENAGRKYMIEESDKIQNEGEEIERILVPVSDANRINSLIDFAVLIRNKKSKEPIYPLAVIEDDVYAKEKLGESKKILEKAIQQVHASDNKVQVLTRVDINISSGITRAIKELGITEVVMGWHKRVSTKDKIFGTTLSNILSATEQMIWVNKIIHPLNSFRRIAVIMPPNAEYEIGFFKCLQSIKQLTQQMAAKCVFWGERKTLEVIDALNTKENGLNLPAEYSEFTDWNDFKSIASELKTTDLFVVLGARNRSISYISELDKVPARLLKYFEKFSLLILYPQQSPMNVNDVNFQISVLSPSPIKENIERINKIGKIVYRAFKK